MVQRILLIRHGQTDWNIEGRWQGTLPIPLNAEGRAQAETLAAHLRHRPISLIVSSDLPRAFETAAALGRSVGLLPQTDARWREFDLGIFQGLTRSEIMERFPSEWEAFRADYWDYCVPGGESRRAAQARIFEAWQALTDQRGEEAAAVSHGGVIKLLLLKLFYDDPALHDLHLENTSVTVIERHGDGWQLVQAANTDHLLPSSRTPRHSLMAAPSESENI